MTDKKTETSIEREYIIPLRTKWKHVARYKKTNRAVKAVKEFIARHMKIRDRDLDKIKIDKILNEFMWARGIKNPPSKIKVKAVKEDGIVNVHLAEIPKDLKYKKERLEKRNRQAREIVEKKKSTMEKLKEVAQHKEEPKTEETSEETKEKEISDKNRSEKQAASIQGTEILEKETAKTAKHETKISKQPKRQFRQALQK